MILIAGGICPYHKKKNEINIHLPDLTSFPKNCAHPFFFVLQYGVLIFGNALLIADDVTIFYAVPLTASRCSVTGHQGPIGEVEI
jgi:hypothetical protein